MREYFLNLHFTICSVFDCLALSFAVLQLYGMVWYLPMQLQVTVAPSFPKLKLTSFELEEVWMLHAGLSLAGACVAKSNGPMPWLSFPHPEH
jgi:hypothetical protein